MRKRRHWKQSGTFTVSPGRNVHGDLTVDGSKTSLYVRDTTSPEKSSYAAHFEWSNIPEQRVTGVLHDLTKVSLLGCLVLKSGSGGDSDERYLYAEIFPHYVIHGQQHVSPADKTIVQIALVVDDASTLFHDFHAFGTMIDARPLIDQITRAQSEALDALSPGRPKRFIETGPHPVIQYFTGKTEIFSAQTAIGKISASHSPTYNIGGSGVRLKDKIVVTIDYREGVAFKTAIDHTSVVLRFLEIVAGRKQNLVESWVRVEHDQQSTHLQVHWSFPPKRKSAHEKTKPHPGDLLIDAVNQTESFVSLLTNWISRDDAWREARQRFSTSFAHQSSYPQDRLIGAANMFDILPAEAVPPDVALTTDLRDAKVKCQDIFSKLPNSPERDSILGALGRIGKSSLKQKIRHRAGLLTDALGNRFPELFTVTDEAVNCRNFYVHGSSPRFDYSKNFGLISFFTDTLEFVFAASDFIESGWDIHAWIKAPTGMSHPFGGFRVSYAANLKELKTILTPR